MGRFRLVLVLSECISLAIGLAANPQIVSGQRSMLRHQLPAIATEAGRIEIKLRGPEKVKAGEKVTGEAWVTGRGC